MQLASYLSKECFKNERKKTLAQDTVLKFIAKRVQNKPEKCCVIKLHLDLKFLTWKLHLIFFSLF